MKKIIHAILTIALAAMVMQTGDMFAANKRNYRSRRGSVTRKRRLSPQAQRIQRQKQAVLAKNPVAKKEQAEINQQVKQNTLALENAVKEKESAKTPEEKIVAEKNIHELSQELLATLKVERNFISDVYAGYGAKAKENAESILAKKLYPIQKKVLDALSKKEAALALVTDKGRFWNAAKKGKEQEYNDLLAQVNKLKDTLSRIETAVYNHEVIAGEEWSYAYKTLLGAGALASTAAIANLALYGGAGMVGKAAVAAGSGLSSMPGWLKEKTGGTWEWGKWAATYGVKTASSLFFLYNSWNQAKVVYSMALYAYNTALGEDKKDKKANLDNAKADMDAKKAKYDTALAQANAQKSK